MAAASVPTAPSPRNSTTAPVELGQRFAHLPHPGVGLPHEAGQRLGRRQDGQDDPFGHGPGGDTGTVGEQDAPFGQLLQGQIPPPPRSRSGPIAGPGARRRPVRRTLRREVVAPQHLHAARPSPGRPDRLPPPHGPRRCPQPRPRPSPPNRAPPTPARRRRWSCVSVLASVRSSGRASLPTSLTVLFAVAARRRPTAVGGPCHRRLRTECRLSGVRPGAYPEHRAERRDPLSPSRRVVGRYGVRAAESRLRHGVREKLSLRCVGHRRRLVSASTTMTSYVPSGSIVHEKNPCKRRVSCP